jgi:hypothetical protein
MAKYSPGEYFVTIRGTSGIEAPVSTTIVLKLVLVDPCPTAKITHLQQHPFADVTYPLGTEAIAQAFLVSDLVTLSTQVDCGPIILEFID